MSESGGDIGPGPHETVAPWEWALLGVFCAALLAFWIAHYHRFTVPNGDYVEIEQTSKQIWSGHLPSNYKRMPLLSLLMGPLAKIIPAQRPYLEAALILNIAFSLAMLPLLFIFARRLLGWAAILPVVVYATLAIFLRSALAPLIEPSLGFFVLLTLVLWQRGSVWQYAAAFAAAMARYEAVALIAICFVLNVAHERRVWKHLLLSALASTGFLAWMILSVTHSTLVNPYVEQMNATAWKAEPGFIMQVMRQSFGGLRATVGGNAQLGICVLLTGLGIYAAWSRFRRETIALWSFFAIYVAVHVAFGVDRPRYAYPVAWIPFTYLTLGILAVVVRLRPMLAKAPRFAWKVSSLGVALILVCIAVPAVWTAFQYATIGHGVLAGRVYGVLLGAILALTGLYALLTHRRSHIAAAVACLGAIVLVAPAAGRGLGVQARTSWNEFYQHYDHYRLAEWLKAHMKPGERALVPNGQMVKFCFPFDAGAVMFFGDLPAKNEADLIRDAAKARVTYVCYVYHRPVDRKDSWSVYLNRVLKTDLIDLFMDGRDHPCFKRIAKIDLPPAMREPPVLVYRFVPESIAVETNGRDPALAEPRP